MEDRIICFTRGLSLKEVQNGNAAFSEMDPHAKKLIVTPVTEDMCSEIVGVVVGKTLEELTVSGTPDISTAFDDVSGDAGGFRVVVMLAQDKEPVLQIMRSFKKVLPDPQDVIFAMITRDALAWTFQYYLDHLAKEHEYMKTHSPAEDPDMKRM